jgi:hypothetical protein
MDAQNKNSNTTLIIVFVAALVALLIGVAALGLYLLLRNDTQNPEAGAGTEDTPVAPTPMVTLQITMAPTVGSDAPTATVIAPAGVFVRTGPGSNYPPLGTAPQGAQAAVVGVSADGGWWIVSLPGAPGDQGWVSAEFVVVVNAEIVPVVPAPPTPTPPATASPTATPVPGVIFTADPTSINAGETAVLTWMVEGVQAVYLYPVGANWPNFPVEGQDTEEVNPFITTTYELRVVKADNSAEIRQIEIQVNGGLTSGTWTMQSYGDGSGDLEATLSGVEVTARFDSAGTLEGSGGCNSYSGGFTAYGTVLRVGALATTRMACDSPEGVMEQEAAYLAALQSAANFEIAGNQLTVLNSGGQTVLTFARS